MMREWKLRFTSLAMAALVVTGCDSGTDPDNGIEDLDAQAVAGAVDAILPPVEASADAQFAIADFMLNVLGGFGAEPSVAAFERTAMIDRAAHPRIAHPGLTSMVRSASVAAEAAAVAGIPAELFGRTYVWDPNAGDIGEWVVDDSRVGAPTNGVRVIWYLTTEVGYAMPLQERGHVDLTNATVGGLDGIRMQIVSTSGATGTLADFTQAYQVTETSSGWTERFELEGVFGTGAEQVDADIALFDSGSSTTFDETYGWDLAFTGPDGSYTWQLDGSWDDAAESYDDAYAIIITRGSEVTRLDLDMTGVEGENGTGTLSHKGVTVANITVTDSEFVFAKPGGGSFTAQEAANLETLTFTMFIYGPLLILSLFSVFLFV